MFIEFGEFESRAEAEAAFAKLGADKEFQGLLQERAELGTIVEGTQEDFILTDY